MKEFAGPRGLMFKNFTDYMFNERIILKSQQRFKSDRYNVYTWQINNSTLKINLLIKLQRIHTEQTHSEYANARRWWKYKMINFDDYANENKTEHNLKWPYI